MTAVRPGPLAHTFSSRESTPCGSALSPRWHLGLQTQSIVVRATSQVAAVRGAARVSHRWSTSAQPVGPAAGGRTNATMATGNGVGPLRGGLVLSDGKRVAAAEP